MSARFTNQLMDLLNKIVTKVQYLPFEDYEKLGRLL